MSPTPPPPAPSPALPGPPGDRSFPSQPGSGQWPEMPSSGRRPGGHQIPGRGWRQLRLRPRPPSLGWKGAPRTCCLRVGGRGQLPTGLGWWRTQEVGAGGHCPPRAQSHPGFGELCPPPPSTHESQLQGPLGSWGKAQRAPECPQTFRNAASDGLLGLTQEAQVPQPLFPLGRPTV